MCYKCTLHFSTPLRLRVRLGVFRRREGFLLAAHLGPSLLPRVVLRPSFFTRRYLTPRCVAGGPSSRVVHSPFVFVYVVFLSFPYARDGFLLGQTDVFPVCGRLHLWLSQCVFLPFCGSLPRGHRVRGRSDVFPDRVRVHAHCHFPVSLQFHCPRV